MGGVAGSKRQPKATERALTAAQERAVELLAQGQSMGETADAVGVHRVTLWGWTRLPGFVEARNELRREAWRAAADRMRRNVTRAAELIGTVLEDGAASTRDRLLAAKMALEGAGALKENPPRDDRVETWEAIVAETAKSAAGLLDRDHEVWKAVTPGQKWACAGLTSESFGQVSRLRRDLDRTRAYCERVLADLRRHLDAEAFESQDEEDPETD